MTPDIAMRWRSSLLRALVHASLNCSSHGSADSAIRYVLDAWALKRSSKIHLVRKLSISPAMYVLVGRLALPHFRNTDCVLWDRLTQLNDEISARNERSSIDMSLERLRLYRPISPDVNPTLDMLRRFAKSPLESDLSLSDYATAEVLMDMMTKAVTILKSQGRDSEADWVVSLARQHVQGDERSSRVERALTEPLRFRKHDLTDPHLPLTQSHR